MKTLDVIYQHVMQHPCVLKQLCSATITVDRHITLELNSSFDFNLFIFANGGNHSYSTGLEPTNIKVCFPSNAEVTYDYDNGGGYVHVILDINEPNSLQILDQLIQNWIDGSEPTVRYECIKIPS